MSTIKEIEIVEKLGDSPIGRKFIYHRADVSDTEVLRLSTDFKKIGIEWDVLIRNKTEVIVLTDPVIIDSPYGIIPVTKVMASGFTLSGDPIPIQPWAPTMNLFLFKE